MDIDIIPILNDNYAYFLRHNGMSAVIDPGEAGPILEFMEDQNILTLDRIFITHHHGDHIAGIPELKSRFGTKVIGPEKDRHRIPGMDLGLQHGDAYNFNGSEAKIFETPGHASGHIIFYFEEEEIVFTGDVLFSMGCGRLFEGTAEDMWNSLQIISNLPDETQIYCGHEYTQSNGAFCLSIEPDNADLKKRMDEVEQLRSQNKPTLPVTLANEKKTNVFLRSGSASRFAELRKMKDTA